jgi:hypothetical protein
VQTGVIKQPSLQLSVPISFERAHLNSDDDFFFSFVLLYPNLGELLLLLLLFMNFPDLLLLYTTREQQIDTIHPLPPDTT